MYISDSSIKTSSIKKPRVAAFLRQVCPTLGPDESKEVDMSVFNHNTLYATVKRLQKKGVIPSDVLVIRTKGKCYIGRP